MNSPVQHRPAPGGSPSARLAFNGELLESSTGVYFLGNGYRVFSPLLMIFIQPDSWSPFGAGGLNAYAYCKGDPVNAADPTGHMPFLGPMRLNGGFKAPAFSPYGSRPGSPFTASAQASRYLADFIGEPATIPPVVAVGSPVGLASAPVSPSRSTAPSPQPSHLSSPSSPALASSNVRRKRLGTASYRRQIEKHKVARQEMKEHIAKAIPDMIDSRNAAGIQDLAAGNYERRTAVLQELYANLPLTEGVRNHTRRAHGRITLQTWHLTWLENNALRSDQRDMVFYRALRNYFWPA
ncbi:RHS repeat-associated core domain-containing protein [Pseudomonas sp. NyZ201]|uniref:RHS repeat-associated core domain-containing protein n=1 Tax=Pseudomonas sp. NyZ201 TaxID=3409857 RepID=UPI003CE9D192